MELFHLIKSGGILFWIIEPWLFVVVTFNYWLHTSLGTKLLKLGWPLNGELFKNRLHLIFDDRNEMEKDMDKVISVVDDLQSACRNTVYGYKFRHAVF